MACWAEWSLPPSSPSGTLLHLTTDPSHPTVASKGWFGCQSQSLITLRWNLKTAAFLPVMMSQTNKDPHWLPLKMYRCPVVSKGDHRHRINVCKTLRDTDTRGSGGRRGRGRGKMRSHGCWSAKMEGGTRRVERGSSRDLPVACEGGERPIVGMDDFFGYSWIRLPPVIPVEPRRPSFLHVRGRGPHATNVP